MSVGGDRAARAYSSGMSTPVPRDEVPLPDDEALVLDFERRFSGDPRAKEVAIRTQLGLSATGYYQVLHRAIDNPIALARDPMLVRRLQRIRARRNRARAARTFGID